MRRLRQLVFLLAFVVSFICIVLLLDFTAPNPTHRRTGSAPVPTAADGLSANEIGLAAEQILARDLGVQRNEEAGQRQCFCHDSSYANTGECNVCLLTLETITTSRRPDFIAPNFIAESKNRANLLYDQTDQVDQISDYVDAARALGVPLWLYVRVTTNLSPEFYTLVESTGGGVVRYFVPEGIGYNDPISAIAAIGLAVSLVIMLLIVVFTTLSRVITQRTPRSPLASAQRKVDEAGDFAATRREKLRQQIDRYDNYPHDD